MGCYSLRRFFAAQSSLGPSSAVLRAWPAQNEVLPQQIVANKAGLDFVKRWPEAFGPLNHSAEPGSGSAAAGHAGWLVTGHGICTGTEAWLHRLKQRKFSSFVC